MCCPCLHISSLLIMYCSCLLYVTKPAKIDHVSANYTELSFCWYLSFRIYYPMSVSFRWKPIKFYSSEKVFCGSINSYQVMVKQIQTKSAIFTLRWLIFAGPVTYVVHCSLSVVAHVCKLFTAHHVWYMLVHCLHGLFLQTRSIQLTFSQNSATVDKYDKPNWVISNCTHILWSHINMGNSSVFDSKETFSQ